MHTNANFIANRWRTEGSGEFLEVFHKYHGKQIGKIPQATEAQMEEAIQAAVKAFEVCKKWTAGKRSSMMQDLLVKIEANRDQFVQLIINEGGKPRSYASAEVERAITTLKYGMEEARRIGGEVVPIDFDNGEGKTAFTKRFPIGVVASITPFNFPLNLVMHKLAPVLATGCTTVIKPAPQAPMSCLFLAELMKEVGYPEGVINVLCCDIPVAEKLVKDDRIAKLSFTGSDKVGWYLKSICGKKKVTLELGGNAAVLVDEDAEIDQLVDRIAIGAYLYAGQICISTQRIFVHQKLFQSFKIKLSAAIENLVVGDPNESNNQVGPLIDEGHLDRIDDWVKEALDQGAECLAGGKIVSREHHLYAPTLLTSTKPDMKVCAEEAFGPIAVLESVNSFEDGLAAINHSKYGLQAGIFTNRFEHFQKAFEVLEVGGLMMNDIPGFRIDNMPYGGVKDSGIGREGLKYAIEEMTEPKLLVF